MSNTLVFSAINDNRAVHDHDIAVYYSVKRYSAVLSRLQVINVKNLNSLKRQKSFS